ncbi:MAG: hemerythrin domain-containing protein [Anaerolineae bacterium]|nr:hemerythrin domain-containing protein [Anaerolineae bacterium]
MTLLTQPLRDEHKELLPHIEEILTAANLVGDAPLATLRQAVDNVAAFLTHHLIPHAQAEDLVLYPVVDKAVGTPEALATMRFDHVEIGRMTARLVALQAGISGSSLNAAQVRDLRETLYGLYTLVKTHFIKEEELFLPILDAHLTPADAHQMFESMEAAAAEAKRQTVH